MPLIHNLDLLNGTVSPAQWFRIVEQILNQGGSALAWAKVAADGTILSKFNITGTTAIPVASVYPFLIGHNANSVDDVIGTAQNTDAAGATTPFVQAISAGAFSVSTFNAAGVPTNRPFYVVINGRPA